MTRIVCVGAHPDDVEIGMGATVAKFAAEGHEVTLIDLTDGEPTPQGTHETRMLEAARAARSLGAMRRTLDLPNRYLFDTVEARTTLAEVLRETRPDVVFAPYPQDAHPDHIAAASIVDAARFYAKFTKTAMRGEPHYPTRIYRYMAVHLRLVREPSFVVDVSDHLDAKLIALRCYESQFESNTANAGIIDMMKATAEMWGRTIGTSAGEPFFAAEPVGLRTFDALL